MRKRPFGKRCGFEIPPVNIGGMRLPEGMDDSVELIRHAIDAGMTYIDTSRGYNNSELKFAEALKDGYREQVILSTKWSPWAMKIEPKDDLSADCVRRRIDEQLKRLQVDYLDFYQIWSINDRTTFKAVTAKGGMVEGIRKAMDEGIVGHTGFTTHDRPEDLVDYLPEADWCEILLVSYNMLSTHYAPVLTRAHELGIGTILMNPLAGGKLSEQSEVLLRLADEVGARSTPELAIRFVLSNQHVDAITSGIRTKEDVDGAVAAAEAGPFTDEQMERVIHFLQKAAPEAIGFCTGCGYCMPCPQGVNIPEIMGCVYEDRYWGLTEAARERYRHITMGGTVECIECGECIPKCTQRLAIISEIRYAKEHYGESRTSTG